MPRTISMCYGSMRFLQEARMHEIPTRSTHAHLMNAYRLSLHDGFLADMHLPCHSQERCCANLLLAF